MGWGTFGAGNLSTTGDDETGLRNTAIGYQSMYATTIGYRNTAVGWQTLFDNTTGYENTAIGRAALNNNVVGNQNTAIGKSALFFITTGSNNIALGYNAGAYITTGSNNIIIGDAIDVPSATGDNQLNIGDTIYGDLSTGNVGIGETSPPTRLSVKDSQASTAVVGIRNESTNADADGLEIQIGPANNPGAGNHFITFYDGNGTEDGKIQGAGGGAVAYTTTSDERVKENIRNTSYGLTDLLNIKVRDFNFIDGGVNTTGFIAQELHEVYPEAVSVGGDDPNKEPWGVNYGALSPLLVRAVQEQQEQISLLQSGIGVIETNVEDNTLAISDMGTILTEHTTLSESTSTTEPNSEFLALLDELAIRLDVVEAQLAANDTKTIDAANNDYYAPGIRGPRLTIESSGTIDQNNNYMALIDRLTTRMDEMEASQAERDYQAQIDAQQAEIEELKKQNGAFKLQLESIMKTLE